MQFPTDLSDPALMLTSRNGVDWNLQSQYLEVKYLASGVSTWCFTLMSLSVTTDYFA